MMDSELKISNSIDDMNKFIKYTDTSILGYLNFINNNEVKNIYKNFRERKIYKLIKLFVLSNDDKNMELKVNEIINSLDEKTKSTIEIYSVKLGFISGNGTNPLDNILLYQNNDQILKYDKNYVSKLIPNSYQEKNIFIFSKDRNIETIKMILGKIDENKI